MDDAENIALALAAAAKRVSDPSAPTALRLLLERGVIEPGERLEDWADALDDGDSGGQA